MKRFSADSAEILPLHLLYEANSAEILHFARVPPGQGYARVGRPSFCSKIHSFSLHFAVVCCMKPILPPFCPSICHMKPILLLSCPSCCYLKPILMPCCTFFCHVKPIMLTFCPFEPSFFNENPRMKRSSADSADNFE